MHIKYDAIQGVGYVLDGEGDWDESAHPRDEKGQFSAAGGKIAAKIERAGHGGLEGAHREIDVAYEKNKISTQERNRLSALARQKYNTPVTQKPAVSAESILSAAHKLSPQRDAIRIHTLRQNVGGTKEEQDRVLTALHEKGHIAMYRDDIPARVTKEERESAYMLNGDPRHILYVK